ncbi:MAG: rhamnan synthesis F family protein [Leptothrix sp. (in: b-proteobacteria)]
MQPSTAEPASTPEPVDANRLTPDTQAGLTEWHQPWSAVVVCVGRAAHMTRPQAVGLRQLIHWLRTAHQRAGGAADAQASLLPSADLASQHGIDGVCVTLPMSGAPAHSTELTQLLATPSLGIRFCVRLDEPLCRASDTTERLAPLLAAPHYLHSAGQPIVFATVSDGAADRIARLRELQQRLTQRHGSAVALIELIDTQEPPAPAPSPWPSTWCLRVPDALPTERGRRGRAQAHLKAATQFQLALDGLTQQNRRDAGPGRVLVLSPWPADRGCPGLAPHPVQGRAMLHALTTTLANHTHSPTAHRLVADTQQRFHRRHDACAVVHLFHEDLIAELIEQTVAPLADVLDVVITVRADVSTKAVRRIVSACPGAYLLITENRGRDVRPFMLCLDWLQQRGYRIACKLHSKKSPHRPDGDAWRTSLVGDLLGSRAVAIACLKQLQAEPDLGMLTPVGALALIDPPGVHHGNRAWLNRLLPLRATGRPADTPSDPFQAPDPVFPAGTMFWFRTTALAGLLDHPAFDSSSFEPELGQLDGTLAHALERLMALQVQHAGMRVAEVAHAFTRDTVPATEKT